MTNRILIVIVMLSLALVAHAKADTQANVLRIVADGWPPMTGSELPSGGFSVQLTQEILHALGYSTSVEFVPWKRIMRTRQRGIFEVIPAIWEDKNRDADFHLSQPYLSYKLLFVSLNEQPFTFSNMPSLKNKRVGIVSSYAYPEAFLKYTDVDWQAALDVNQNLKKLLAKRLDLVVGTEEVIRYEAYKLEGGSNLYYDTQHPLETRFLHIAVNSQYEGHNELIRDIDRMMLVFKGNGRFDELKKLHGLL